MTSPKRKRKPTRTTTNKRPKYTLSDTDSSSSEEEETSHGSQEEWEALRILQQRNHGPALEYEIAWAGIDPATGKQWAPTWEKAGNASEALRASWKEDQTRRARGKKETAAADKRSTQLQSARGALPAQAAQNHSNPTFKRPDPPTSAPTTESPTQTSQSTAVILGTATIDLEAPIPDWTSPQINIDLRGDSFNRGEYELHAEIPESQSSPPKSGVEETELESSQLFASQPACRASGVVLDTQGSDSAASYIPVTQEELASSLHSDSSDGSNEDHIVGYSHLLDIEGALKLGLRARSPSTSIAETIADTTQDLRSQHQFETQQELSGIPDTLESQSPATFNKTNRTGAQSESSNSHPTDSVSTQPRESIEQHQIDSPVLFVESSTQFDHDTSAPGFGHQQQDQDQDEPSATAQQQQEAIETLDAQFSTSIEESELLAVADTPQVSQLTSTAWEQTPQEAQLSSTHQLDSDQPSAEHEADTILTERSVWEDDAQFPFHSQRPALFDPRSAARSAQRALTEPPRTFDAHEYTNARLSEGPLTVQQESDTLAVSEESTTIDEISQPIREKAPRTSLENQTSSQQSHIQRDDWVHESTARGDINNTEGQVTPSAGSQLPPSTAQSSGSPDHNAQLVPSTASLIQEDVVESILATVEIDPAETSQSKHSSPGSKHDSSQETPERDLESVEESSSPIAHPPNYSLRTLDSNVPPRPATPTVSSSLSKMAEGASEKASAQVARLFDELMAPGTRERKRSRNSRSSVAPSTDAATNNAASQSNNTLALPKFNISAEGTRSPSTVPDRSPAPPPNTSLRTVPATTSLRAVAFHNANKVAERLSVDPPVVAPKTADKSSTEKDADLVAAVAIAAAHSLPVAPSPPTAHDDFENHDDDANIDDDENASNADSINDYDEDDESVYDDELKLIDEEYIVPLYIEGRQRDTYTEYIQRKEELLNEVLVHSPAPIAKLDEVDRALTYLKGVETHPDLTYAEAESAAGVESPSLAEVKHGAQFGIDNSVKFKFLGRLFDRIRDKRTHVVLLLDEDNRALLNILKTFLVAGGYNFKMPSTGHQSAVSSDSLSITVFPKSVTPVLSPVNLIICLDGVQDAAQARQRTDPALGKTIPVLHLVIPQTVGHIERYILATSQKRLRIETILAALARMQTRNEVGNAIDIDTPSAGEAAQMVTSWLFPEEGQEFTDWPLPSIGSARSFIEWDATQPSVRSAASSPAPERTKRPLEQENSDSDPAKRMRYAPQSHIISNSSAIRESEVTRVSDSMPGTAASETARLELSLGRVSTALIQERKERREESVMWDRQQTEHENRQGQYRRLFNEKTAVDRALETMTANREKIRGQIDVQSAEIRTLREELEALRDLTLASSDEKDVEITRLRKELETANLEREKALNSVKSQEGMMDFLKDNYRDAQNAAAQLRTDVETLTSQNTKLAHQASGEVAKLKQIHFDRSTRNLMQQNKALQSETATLKATLKAKEEELVRAKNNSGRAAYGTRGQSTTPQPKTRSRAASPERGFRAPRGGGRISNLVAEER